MSIQSVLELVVRFEKVYTQSSQNSIFPQSHGNFRKFNYLNCQNKRKRKERKGKGQKNFQDLNQSASLHGPPKDHFTTTENPHGRVERVAVLANHKLLESIKPLYP
ncbi:hypothetical protein ANTPLA_LOCUS6989 [Anthophora plagiata]